MNEATINIFNAIAFPPATIAGRVAADPFFTRESDPVYAAIAREFGRLGFLLLVAIIAGVALIATAVQTLSPAGVHHTETPGATTAPAVATASHR